MYFHKKYIFKMVFVLSAGSAPLPFSIVPSDFLHVPLLIWRPRLLTNYSLQPSPILIHDSNWNSVQSRSQMHPMHTHSAITYIRIRVPGSAFLLLIDRSATIRHAPSFRQSNSRSSHLSLPDSFCTSSRASVWEEVLSVLQLQIVFAWF